MCIADGLVLLCAEQLLFVPVHCLSASAAAAAGSVVVAAADAGSVVVAAAI